IGQHTTKFFEIDTARLQHLGGRRVVEHREQQVLDRDEFMLLLPSFDKSHVEGNLEFLRNHMTCLICLRCPPLPPWPPRATAAMTFRFPPSCTARDAGGVARCRSPDRLSRRRPRECTFRTHPCLLDAPAASPV